ncbi:unnamed protein product [Rhizophagus irregularis]|nr:unnamed protein product [Rhizophagus irregularis]
MIVSSYFNLVIRDVRQYPSKVSSNITKQSGSSSYILVSIFSPSVPENCTIKDLLSSRNSENREGRSQ